MLSILTLTVLAGVTVTVPDEAKVRGLELKAGDVVTVRGDDPREVERVQAVQLGYAPAPGYHRVLRADLIGATLRSGAPGIEIEIAGATHCRVLPEVETIVASRLEQASRKALMERFKSADAEFTYEGNGLGDVLVPAGAAPAELKVAQLERSVHAGAHSIPIQIWVDGQLYRTVHAPWRVAIWRRRAVLKRAIAAGEELGPQLFEFKRVAVAHGRENLALPMNAVAGAIAVRALAAGAVVTERDVHRETVLRRGDMVSVRVLKGSVSATDLGTVHQDGRVGERVRVTLRSTGRELIGQVRSRELVEITLK